MKVLNVEPYGYSPEAIAAWEHGGHQYLETDWSQVERSEWPDVEVLVVRLARFVDESLLRRFPSLRLIITATTGLDHLDAEAIRKRGIEIVSLRSEKSFLNGIPSTAEHTWALLMSLVRNIPKAVNRVAEGEWNRDSLRGVQLKGKRLGIIGMGRTGRKVAAYAKAFDMSVSYLDPYVNLGDPSIPKLEDCEELFPTCDVLSWHIHLDETTRHHLNEDNIGSIRTGAFLVNTSRGAIWDEHGVAAALVRGEVAGVAVDVLSDELTGGISSSPLFQAQRQGLNIIITPHIGGATWDAMWQCETYLAEKVVARSGTLPS